MLVCRWPPRLFMAIHEPLVGVSGRLPRECAGPIFGPREAKFPHAGAGHTLEIALRTDPHVRAAGEIQPDGSFALRTLHSGLIHEGAIPGDYLARIVLSDDEPQKQAATARLLPPRHLRFDKSGLALKVPGDGPVALKLVR